MKKTYRLHYKYIDGYEPEQDTRNYVCFTLIDPNKQGMKTLAVDEDALRRIMRTCKDDAHREYIAEGIQAGIKRRIEAGHYSGSIMVSV